MREFDRVLSDLERSPRKVLLAAPIRDVLSRLPRAQRDRVTGVLSEDAPIGSLRGSGPFDALIVRDQMAMLKALERWVREAATATGEVRPGLPKEELLRWATDAGVRELLDLPVRLLVDPRGAWTYGDRSVVSALLEPPTAGARETVLERVQVALCDRLKVAADAVQKGRIEERSLPVDAPTDPRLASLWMALVAVRAGLRAEVEPSGGVDAEARLDPAKAGLVITTWRTCPRTGALAGSVGLGLRGAPALSCGCGRRDGRCGLGLAVVDQALRGLHGALGPKVADWLAEPMWVDRLRKLDAVLTPRTSTATLGWRIDLAREVAVRPVTVTSHGLVPAVRGAVEAHDERDRELLVLTARDDGDATFTALRRLAGHPRVFVDGAPAEVVIGAIGLRLVPTMFGARLVVLIDGALAGANALDGAIRVGQHGLALRRGAKVVVYAAGASLRALVGDLRESGDTFRTDALPALMERWPQIAMVAPAEVDPELVGGAIDVVGEVIVVLASRGQGLAVDVRMRVGGTSYAPGEGEGVAWQVVDGKLVEGRRDLEAERVVAEGVRERLALLATSVVIVDPDAAWTLLDQLRDGFTVVWTGPRRRALPAPRPEDLRLNVGTADRWLAVGGEVQLDGRAVPFAELVAAMRERRGTVVIGDDLVRLAGPLVEHLRALDAVATTGADGRWLVPEVAAGVLGELASDAVIDGDVPFRLAFDRWRGALASEPMLPVGFVADLRDYQLAGFRFLARLAAWTTGGLLCDDMGLGKTVQALALLVSRAHGGPQLVIAPTSVMTNWVREAARFAPGLTVHVHHGASRDVGAPGPGTVLVTSWDLLVRDEEVLRSVRFATIVFDEAQATKNATTRRAKSARALSAAFRVVLTGTPLENRLSDLWSLVDLAVPGLLGDSRSFRDRFATPIERNADESAREALGRLLAPFLLRRTKAAVASELPARSEVIVSIDLDPAGRAVYDLWRTAALRDLGRRDLPAQNQRVLVLAALTALRQTACSAHLVDKTLPRTSAKLERLREIVAELREEGHQALVFSQFVSLLGIVREMLAADGVKLRYLDGSTSAAVRQEEVDRFQQGDGDVFLISLKAGGTGLNLTAATYVIHLDPWWNPAVEDQASDRAHRIGQNRPVTVYKLVARGTVEEAIVALQGEKRALVDGVLGDAGKAASLPLDELVALLSYGDPATG